MSPRRIPAAMESLVALALCILFAGPALGREDDAMAPGPAQIRTLESDDQMSVSVLDRVFRGTWKGATDPREVPLLAVHWRGARASLARHVRAIAELTCDDAARMRYEFISERENPVGICDEKGIRLYYLQRAIAE